MRDSRTPPRFGRRRHSPLLLAAFMIFPVAASAQYLDRTFLAAPHYGTAAIQDFEGTEDFWTALGFGASGTFLFPASRFASYYVGDALSAHFIEPENPTGFYCFSNHLSGGVDFKLLKWLLTPIDALARPKKSDYAVSRFLDPLSVSLGADICATYASLPETPFLLSVGPEIRLNARIASYLLGLKCGTTFDLLGSGLMDMEVSFFFAIPFGGTFQKYAGKKDYARIAAYYEKERMGSKAREYRLLEGDALARKGEYGAAQEQYAAGGMAPEQAYERVSRQAHKAGRSEDALAFLKKKGLSDYDATVELCSWFMDEESDDEAFAYLSRVMEADKSHLWIAEDCFENGRYEESFSRRLLSGMTVDGAASAMAEALIKKDDLDQAEAYIAKTDHPEKFHYSIAANFLKAYLVLEYTIESIEGGKHANGNLLSAAEKAVVDLKVSELQLEIIGREGLSLEEKNSLLKMSDEKRRLRVLSDAAYENAQEYARKAGAAMKDGKLVPSEGQ